MIGVAKKTMEHLPKWFRGGINPALAPVKVGFTTDHSGQKVAALLGVHLPVQGDPTAQVSAMVDYMNTHGGLQGHKVVPDVIEVDTTSTDTTEWNNACIQFTEDDHVFAVIGTAGNQITPMACYAQHHTPFLTFDAVLADSLEYREWQPYVYLPGLSAEDQTIMAELDGLQAQGYFTPSAHIGVMVQDVQEYHRIVDSQLMPRLNSMGYSSPLNPDIKYVVNSNGPGNAGEVVQQIQQTAVQFKIDGVDHVIFMYPGGGGWLFFWTAAYQQQYYPRYAYSSADEPHSVQESNATQGGQNAGAMELRNAIGIGYVPGLDTTHEAFPDNPQAAICLAIYKAEGQTYTAADSATNAMAYCSSMLAMQSAAATLAPGQFNSDGLGRALARLGSYQMALDLPGGSGFSPGRPEAATHYRLSHFDSGCTCFLYNSPNLFPYPF